MLNEEPLHIIGKEYYEENKDKPWTEWLSIDSFFPKPGKQGITGIMTSKTDKTIKYVFKLSQRINYLINHELTIMSSLNELSSFCPHFCRSFGGFITDIDSRKKDNPFDLTNTKYPIEREVLLMEYIKGYKFCNYIYSEKIHERILYSTIKQILMAISIAQKHKEFSHHDLHSNNIIMRKCNKDVVLLYILDNDNQFCIPTYGHIPVIIDYGFSYIKDMENEPYWATYNHTDIGFMSDRFDQISDPKLFLVTVSDEIKNSRNTKNSKKLFNISKNVFNCLKIDWSSGWDNITKKCASDYVIDALSKYKKYSKLFREYEYFCIDLITSLIILPLQKQNISSENIAISCQTFINEFIKIEESVSDPFFCLYILKGIVDSARSVRADYKNKETRETAVNYFKTSIYEKIDSIASFCRPKDVHFEKMLCSLLCLIKNIEGILYLTMENICNKKQKQYEKLHFKTPEQFCALIDINIPCEYTFTNKTLLYVIDSRNKTIFEKQLNENQIEEINNYCSISRGPELFKIISSV